jgi:hypothetical protein
MGGGLPSGSPLSGILITPSSSDTPLPVLSMHQPIDEDTWAQPDTQQQQRQRQQSGVQKQQQQQSSKQQTAQDMPGTPAAAGGAGGFGFFRSLSGRRTSGSSSRPMDPADTTREGSDSYQQGSSSGRPPTFMQGLAQSMRASGMVLRDMSFDSKGPGESRGPSWSNRQGSQSSSMGEHPWFV